MRLTELSKGSMECNDRSAFLHNLTCRILFMTIQKALLSISMITIFFLIYFYFLGHNFFEVTIMPETWIDELIPFEPLFFYAYVSLWVYLSLSFAIIKDKKELKTYLYYQGILGLSAILFYLFFPTTIMQHNAIANDSVLQIVKSIDMAGNAFPSMHVASSLFAFFWLVKHLENMKAPRFLKLLSTLWFLAIVYSTMAIDQHLFIDVIGGILLGLPISILAIKKLN